MPHVPRYETVPVKAETWDDLRVFVEDFEDAWAGDWARSQNTAQAGHAYAQALCAPAERKSMEPLSARADENRNRFYQFITRSPWDWLEVQDRLVTVGLKHQIFTKAGGLYLDDTAHPKKGVFSVGVKRQWCGVLGKEENCQVLPTLVWGAPKAVNGDSVVWPLGMQLYLPEEWAQDEKRRETAGVPGEIDFQTKTEIGLDMLDRVRERVPHAFVGADAFYGRDSEFRKQLREWNEPYVVGLQPQRFNCVRVGTRGNEIRSAQAWAGTVKWRRVTWTQGSQEPLTAKVARLKVKPTLSGTVTEEEGWLLLEEREGEVKAWMCWGMDKASLKTLVTRAHHRWVIEDAHGLMKGELGLDHFEGRQWNGLHHHVTMVMLSLAFLQSLRCKVGEKSLAELRAVRVA